MMVTTTPGAKATIVNRITNNPGTTTRDRVITTTKVRETPIISRIRPRANITHRGTRVTGPSRLQDAGFERTYFKTIP
jgi:hypothetical protein